jgi:transposase
MTRIEVITKAMEGRIRWVDAAEILGITDRQVRRLKERAEQKGIEYVVDQRGGRPRRKRVSAETVEALCGLRREMYMDFSVRHFWEHAVEKHGLKLSYSHALAVLQAAKLAEKLPKRGTYRRRRERRPMRGMLLHIDASTHAWFGDTQFDLVVVLDDADGRILYGMFFPQEGVASTLAALAHVLKHHGRFAELYHDRGSHYGRREGLDAEEPSGQVQRVLRAVGVRQIFARSPEARGRSERNFRTHQERLVAELKLHGISDMEAANRYLWEGGYIADFNRRFMVKPAQKESAFVRLAGVDFPMLTAIEHERTAGRDNVVRFEGMQLQLPEGRKRATYAGCPVKVHELANELVVTWQGNAIGRFTKLGDPLPTRAGRAA